MFAGYRLSAQTYLLILITSNLESLTIHPEFEQKTVPEE